MSIPAYGYWPDDVRQEAVNAGEETHWRDRFAKECSGFINMTFWPMKGHDVITEEAARTVVEMVCKIKRENRELATTQNTDAEPEDTP